MIMTTYFLPLIALIGTAIGNGVYNVTIRRKPFFVGTGKEAWNAFYYTGICVLFWHFKIAFN
jgi:hypothetical protein